MAIPFWVAFFWLLVQLNYFLIIYYLGLLFTSLTAFNPVCVKVQLFVYTYIPYILQQGICLRLYLPAAAVTVTATAALYLLNISQFTENFHIHWDLIFSLQKPDTGISFLTLPQMQHKKILLIPLLSDNSLSVGRLITFSHVLSLLCSSSQFFSFFFWSCLLHHSVFSLSSTISSWFVVTSLKEWRSDF